MERDGTQPSPDPKRAQPTLAEVAHQGETLEHTSGDRISVARAIDTEETTTNSGPKSERTTIIETSPREHSTPEHETSDPNEPRPRPSDGIRSLRPSDPPRFDSLPPTPSSIRRVTMVTRMETDQEIAESIDVFRDPYIGALIDDRYEVEARLGEGGMGVVYRCRHTIIDKKVAMKVLRADMARNHEVTERFLNEAKSATSIGSPHIIGISDFGRLPDGATYFVMEFLEGIPLSGALEEGPLSPARIVDIAIQLAEGLGAAHAAGIVHRDLKPDNIFLICNGTRHDFVKILDFGIAKATSRSSKLTQAGQVFGTPHYMSPEQASGAAVDARADIYSVGVMLFELATGKLPFDADNFMAILTQHMYKDAPRISELTGVDVEVPDALEAVIQKCLRKKSDERYQSMAELKTDLLALYEGAVPAAVGELANLTERASRAASRASYSKSPDRSKWLWALIPASAVLAAFLAWGPAGTPQANQEQPPPETSSQTTVPASTAPSLPPKRSVALAVLPLDAHIYHGAESLGTSPLLLEVGNEPLELLVVHADYLEKIVTIDGKSSSVSVKLEKKRASPPLRPSSPKASESEQIRGPIVTPAAPTTAPPRSEIVDPWATKN